LFIELRGEILIMFLIMAVTKPVLRIDNCLYLYLIVKHRILDIAFIATHFLVFYPPVENFGLVYMPVKMFVNMAFRIQLII